MNTAILLCAVLLAADNSPQVQAKVLYGTAARQQQRADIELWISQAVAKTGSPLAQPYTSWIALTGEQQRLYTSKQGGCIINAKVTERHGRYEVAIDACEGVSLDTKATLKPGECRVIKLTGDPGPNPIFIALKAPLSERAKKRAEAMKANVKTFRLELNYHGEQGKPFYRMLVSVPIMNRLRSSPFYRIVQVKKDEASQIIDHLARDGFLDSAADVRNKKIGPPTMPGYTMKVVAGDTVLHEELGWGLPMIQRLDALRGALPDRGKKDIDLLLGRLSGLRKQWEAQDPGLEAKVGREGSQIRFLNEDDQTVVEITSKFGIDQATIRRKTRAWPKLILVRLHLSGLESFQVGGKDATVEWSVSSTGNHASRVSLRRGQEETALDTKSPYYTQARIVGGDGQIPLKNGYFEVPLPARLLEGNPPEMTLRWIDFYRN